MDEHSPDRIEQLGREEEMSPSDTVPLNGGAFAFPKWNGQPPRHLRLLLSLLLFLLISAISWLLYLLWNRSRFSELQLDAQEDSPVKYDFEVKVSPVVKSFLENDVTAEYTFISDSEYESTSLTESESTRKNLPICKFEDFDIGDILGSGGFAKVYLATHIASKQQVAIKAYQDNPKGLKSYRLEKSMLSRLRHPFIVGLKCGFHISPEAAKANDLSGPHLLVLEYASNGSMHTNRKKSGAKLKKWLAQLVEALNFIHSKKVLHCDIKAGNVLIAGDGNIRLADFGLSQMYNPDANSSRWSGTKSYFAPERVRKENIDYAVDIYSLGILMYQYIGVDAIPRFKKDMDKEELKTKLIELSSTIHTWPVEPLYGPEAADLFKRACDPIKDTRITIPQMKKHPFFDNVDWSKIEKPLKK